MTRRTTRRGFTLTELLVVIAVIGFLATLTALYFPRFQDREYVTRGTEQLQQWLLTARQQARRDGRPTGLRFDVVNNVCRGIRYIQQPEDSAQGKYVGSWKLDSPTPGVQPTAFFRLPVITPGTPPTRVRFNDPPTNPRLPAGKGDYLELYGGGVVHRIEDVPASGDRLVLASTTAELPGPVLPQPQPMPPTDPFDGIPEYAGEPVNYRIIRRPVEIDGEQELVFPDNVGIDFNPSHPTNGAMTRGLVVPSGSTFKCDILFSPSGALIGASAQNVQIIFWVRDVTKSNDTDLLAGHATLVTVQPRTGFVASHPAVTGSDPYQFTKDAKSSGM